MTDLSIEDKQKINKAYWVCSDCGKEHGRGRRFGQVSSWHEDPCDICKEIKYVTEFRDFGYSKHQIRIAKDPYRYLAK